MKHNPRDKWTAEKYTQKAKGEGKWAVDQPGSASRPGKPTGVTSPGGKWALSGQQRPASGTCDPEHKNGDGG